MEQFIIRDFARRTSPDLLAAYAKTHGYTFTTKHRKPGDIADDFEKFLKQDPILYKTADEDLMVVHELANGNGNKLLSDEAKRRNRDLSGIENYTKQEHALWFFLKHRDIFDFAQTQHELVSKNGWAWYQTERELDVTGSDNDIIHAIVPHLTTNYYRGWECHLEHADREKEMCFVAYLKDYIQREPMWDGGNEFKKNAVFHPAFRIYFLYRPDDGLIAIKTTGGSEFADEMIGIFARSAFGVEITTANKLKYVPNLLLDKNFGFETGIEHKVKQIKVVAATFKNISNPQERVSVTCGKKEGKGNADILRIMGNRNVDLINFEVVGVTLRFLFADKPYKGSKGTVTTTITPDKMPLEQKDLHKKAFKILLEWGIHQ